MFSVPLGIMFHADVRYAVLTVFARADNASRTADNRGVHSQVSRMMMSFGVPRLTTAHRSFIASYLGNIVGALLIALPAVYFYLGDYQAGGLVEAQAGEIGLSGTSSLHKGQELVAKAD